MHKTVPCVLVSQENTDITQRPNNHPISIERKERKKDFGCYVQHFLEVGVQLLIQRLSCQIGPLNPNPNPKP
jgi:hypothetical protein